jgi:uncharacterized damage-inducible protein DinB
MESESEGRRFLGRAAASLRDDALPKIREAVGLLSDEEIWQREGGDASNSIGNLLLHLAGNLRQHIVSGVGGAADVRDRPSEFAAAGGPGAAELLDRLSKTVQEACAVLESLETSLLLQKRVIQKKEVVVLDDILHVVEHFAYHAGQIIFAVKARKQHRFPWYGHLDPKPPGAHRG